MFGCGWSSPGWVSRELVTVNRAPGISFRPAPRTGVHRGTSAPGEPGALVENLLVVRLFDLLGLPHDRCWRIRSPPLSERVHQVVDDHGGDRAEDDSLELDLAESQRVVRDTHDERDTGRHLVLRA